MSNEKKTTKAPAAAAPAAAPGAEALKAAQQAREAAAAKDRFVSTGAEPTKRIPPQALGIVNIIKAAGKDGISREELVKQMTGVIQTRQPVGRILTYYQKLIQEVGAVKVQAGSAA